MCNGFYFQVGCFHFGATNHKKYVSYLVLDMWMQCLNWNCAKHTLCKTYFVSIKSSLCIGNHRFIIEMGLFYSL